MQDQSIVQPESAWDHWPKWENSNIFSTKNFKFCGSVSDYSGKTSNGAITILKNRQFIDIYREVLAEKPVNIFEIGFFQGGMPLFIADMQNDTTHREENPLRIVGIDFYAPSDALAEIIKKNCLSETIKLHGGILQDDVSEISSILKSEFCGKPLDLIVDDCSHQYYESKVCFESFFSQLRPGGKYVIEDWGWQHWPGEPWQSKNSPFYGKKSMSNLIVELVMALGSRPDIIARIDIVSEFCVVVTRGPNPSQGATVVLSEITEMAERPFAPM